KIVLKAYEDYWGGPDNMDLPPPGKKRIETVEYIYQPSFTTRLLNLKAGKVTGIQLPEADIFSVIDRDSWIEDGEIISIIPDVTVHGLFPTMNTWWLDFNTNVTNPDRSLKSWQPFADWRLRMAAASAINMTYAYQYIYNRLGVLANTIVPPGTFPPGSYNLNVRPTFSFNLTKAAELIADAYENPLTSADYEMHYYDGSTIPPGVVDNAFSPTNPKTIQLYVQTGADTFTKVLTTMTDNLNAISRRTYGLVWEVVLVPGGQQYTLAARHQVDSYVGGWMIDYNHIMNWMTPMYYSRGAYPSWNLWNLTAMEDLFAQALAADAAVDLAELVSIGDEMNELANEALIYMVWWHDSEYFTRSSWLKGWYHNANWGSTDPCWSVCYFEEP
ncbi:MAG: ABC transporter substrate-binding protein, partial [Candidatus Bathyarchaeia archaeon]